MATDLQALKRFIEANPNAQYKFYWTKDEKVDKWADTDFAFYKRQFVVEVEATGFKSYLMDMWRLKPKSGSTIASVSNSQNRDRVIHADAFKHESGKLWFWYNIWQFYKFDQARNVEIDISFLGLPQKSVIARINDESALTFMSHLIGQDKLAPPSEEETGRENFDCTIIDTQYKRYNLTLTISGEKFDFKPTPSDRAAKGIR